ncbi:MAG: hypothetical protein Q8O05_07690 [Chloroflexota bacterium]|nr:hypothetical protein [Chloroflexota bacterium]
MLEPVLLKSLRILRESGGPLTSREVTEKARETPDYVEKALAKLAERDILTRTGRHYRYNNTPANEKFFERISSVYDKVTGRPERDLAVVGLLAMATQRKYLLRLTTLLEIMSEGGFNAREVELFVDGEVSGGRVGRFRIVLGTRRKILFATPPVLPFHYIAHFPPIDPAEYDRMKKDWIDSGFFVTEEDYLMANYPDEIVNPARECLNREMSHIRDRLKERALAYPRLGASGKEYPSLRWPTILRGYSFVAFHFLISPPLDTIHLQ